MTTSTYTQTQTYTRTDIRRVLSSFAADFAMIGQSTGLRSREDVDSLVNDLIGFAEGKYLQVINLILWDASSRKLRAAKYIVSTSANEWTNERPKNNLWPRTPNGKLQVIATLSSDWWNLDSAAQTSECKRLSIASMWSRTTTDTSHSDMTSTLDRRYSSNSFGIEKTLYQ